MEVREGECRRREWEGGEEELKRRGERRRKAESTHGGETHLNLRRPSKGLEIEKRTHSNRKGVLLD